MLIGLLKERKSPPDHRVPFLPEQCNNLLADFPHLRIAIESSAHRAVADEEYQREGLTVTQDLSECEVVFGVKEVPKEHLMAGKTYVIFSHTIKQQPQNRAMLKRMAELKITLIDYELITDAEGSRTVAFGHYAGLVGAYNGILGYGLKHQLFQLKPAHECAHYAILRRELQKVKLPPIKVVVTGRGRVGRGIKEMLLLSGLKEVNKTDFLQQQFNVPVFTVLGSGDYYKLSEGRAWDSQYFYQHPSEVESIFAPYASVADMLITGAFWHPASPPLFRKEDIATAEFKINTIADVTCDIEGFVPITSRSSTIAEPFYDIQRSTLAEQPAFSAPENITLMAVDNLPCELPRDASSEFGHQLMSHFMPYLLGEDNGTVARATILKDGELQPRYQYLSEYLNS